MNTTTHNTNTTTYNEGFAAGTAAVWTANPYVAGTKPAKEWTRGFNAARDLAARSAA